MNSRRLFLRGLLVGAAAPAIVKAENLMKIWTPPTPKLQGPKIEVTVIDESYWQIEEVPSLTILSMGINDFDKNTPPEVLGRMKQWMLQEDRNRMFVSTNRGLLQDAMRGSRKPHIQSMAFTSQRVKYRS